MISKQLGDYFADPSNVLHLISRSLNGICIRKPRMERVIFWYKRVITLFD